MKISKNRIMTKITSLTNLGESVVANRDNPNKTIYSIDKIELVKESLDPMEEGLSIDNVKYSLFINGTEMEVIDGINEIYIKMYSLNLQYEGLTESDKINNYLSV